MLSYGLFSPKRDIAQIEKILSYSTAKERTPSLLVTQTCEQSQWRVETKRGGKSRTKSASDCTLYLS